MKKCILLLVSFMLLAGAVAAQDGGLREFEESQKQQADAMEAIANATPSLKSLRVLGKHKEMIVEAGQSGDTALMPYLKTVAYNKGLFGISVSSKRLPRSRKDGVEFLAHIALAKLGDPNVLPELFAELESPDDITQDAAISKLAQIGGKEAYRKLFELLEDTSNRPHAADEVVSSKSEHAMGVLSQIFSDSPRSNDRAAWKAWAGKNKHLIE